MSDSGSDDDLLLPEQQADEDWEEWDGDDEENDATKSLFSDAVLPTPEAAFEYDGTHYGFDIRQFKTERQLDDYDVIKVINYTRREVAAGRDPLPALVAAGQQGEAKPWAADEFLNPVLPDDPLITYDYEEQQQAIDSATRVAGASDGASSSSTAAATAAAASGDSAAAVAQLSRQLQALAAENEELKLRVAGLMEAALPREVRDELRAAAAEDAAAPSSSSGSSLQTAAGGASSSAGAGSPLGADFRVAAPVAGGGAAAAAAAVDAQYFDSYSSFDIHQDMLSDKPRTAAYQQALTRNPSLMAGARVLDVGCGTGILSLFAAKGGAAAVVGLDGSKRIAGCARQVVAANKLDASSGSPISIIAGKVEEVDSIGQQQVDVIVSEWMGYALLFECMLNSVLAARDRWLAPGGALLPDMAAIHAAGASRQCLGTDFWKDVYGFNMQPIADELAAAAAREAQVLVRPVEPGSLTTPAVQVHAMDLATMTPAQQDFTAHFELSATAAQLLTAGRAAAAVGQGSGSSSSSSGQEAANSSSGSSGDGGVEVAALVLWFDVECSERFCKDCPVLLSTSPHQPVTHWAQALLPLAQPVQLAAGQGPDSTLSCRLSMARSRARHRSLDISLEYSCGSVKAARIYSMEVSSASSK